jgi:hypothetical protein
VGRPLAVEGEAENGEISTGNLENVAEKSNLIVGTEI